MTCYVDGPKTVAPAAPVERPATAIRPKLDGTAPVVLSDHEMMQMLGIQPIGFLE
jgi:hypothetical protein